MDLLYTLVSLGRGCETENPEAVPSDQSLPSNLTRLDNEAATLTLASF
jgi:hypothetical protein